MRNINASSEDLTGPGADQVGHLVGPEPLRDHHAQGPAVLAAQHACVAGTVEGDPFDDLTALADALADATVARSHVAAPHRTFGIDADPVACHVGPDAPVRQAPVARDVKGGEPPRE